MDGRVKRKTLADLMAEAALQGMPEDKTTADLLNIPLSRGAILPLTEYLDRAEFDLSSGLPGAFADAVTAPARAARGEISEAEQIPEAFNFAGSLTLGSLLAPRPQNAVGMFGGKLSSKNPEPFIDDAAQGFKLTDDLIGRVKSQRQSDETPFLYHSGTSADAGNIRAGLEPQHGKWIQEIAAGATDDISSLLSNSPELAWLSDAPDWVLAKVRRATGRQAVTADDVQKHGHLSIFKPDEYDDVFRVGDGGIDGPDTLLKRLSGEEVKLWDTPIYKTDDMGHWESPFGVERNEWITTDTLLPEATLTGDELLRFLDSMTPAWRSELAANAKTGAAVPLATKALEAQQPQGIRAFHGSPHDFERFDMSKIGTGEGAQAYGHGLYFADAEDVARSYRDKLTDRANFKRPNGETWDPYGNIKHLNVRVMASRGDIDGAIQRAKDIMASEYQPKELKDLAKQDLAHLENIRDTGGISANPGHMYEVNIRADPQDFLDWDKPLSQQSEAVRAKVEALAQQALERQAAYDRVQASKARQMGLSYTPRDSSIESMTGAELARLPGIESTGIPGIRYLDQASRGAGEGSSNYVVFDDAIIDIVKKYGIAGLALLQAAGYGTNEGEETQ